MRRIYKVKKDNNKLVPLSDIEAVKVYEHIEYLESNGKDHSKAINETATETIFDYSVCPKNIKKIVDSTLKLIKGI